MSKRRRTQARQLAATGSLAFIWRSKDAEEDYSIRFRQRAEKELRDAGLDPYKEIEVRRGFDYVFTTTLLEDRVNDMMIMSGKKQIME